MSYVDGYVLAVPTANKAAYIELAESMAELFKAHGALAVIECWGDEVPEGEVSSFPMAVKCRPDETVVFSWALWPSKAVRDQGMQAVMEDERMSGLDHSTMPFDGKRMIFGGFETIVEA